VSFKEAQAPRILARNSAPQKEDQETGQGVYFHKHTYEPLNESKNAAAYKITEAKRVVKQRMNEIYAEATKPSDDTRTAGIARTFAAPDLMPGHRHNEILEDEAEEELDLVEGEEKVIGRVSTGKGSIVRPHSDPSRLSGYQKYLNGYRGWWERTKDDGDKSDGAQSLKGEVGHY
jgi:hypothetical protein